MKKIHLFIIITAVFLSLFIFSANFCLSYAQPLGKRKVPDKRDRIQKDNLLINFNQILIEMENKGYNVSEAQALSEQAEQAMKARRNRREAHRLVTEAMAKLVDALRISNLKLVEDPKANTTGRNDNKKRISIQIEVGKVRIIDTFPLDVAKVSDNTLDNFLVSEVNVKNERVVLNINFPVIVEEYPYFDFILKHNKAFGATGSGQVKFALKHLSDNELNSRMDKIFNMMSQTGIGVARDFQSYDTRRLEVEPQKGEYDFSRSDFAINSAINNDFDFIGRLGLHYGDVNKEGLPTDESAYIAYVRKTVKHNINRIRIWQTLKEPMPGKRNRPGNDAGLDPEDVVRALKLSYSAIKSIDPDSIVYFPGIGAPIRRGGYSSETYIEKIIELGGAQYFDVLGFDAYAYDLEEQIKKHRYILAKYGYNKPLWVAQTGIPAGNINVKLPFRGGGSDRAQIEFMVKEYARAFALRVEKVFWGEFLDKSRAEQENRGPLSDAWNQTGLFYTGTWKMKPAYFTHRLLATALNDFTAVNKLAPNVIKFSFLNRSPVYLVWPE